MGSIAGAAVLGTLGLLIAKGLLLGGLTGLGVGAATGAGAEGAGGATSGANAATQMGTAAVRVALSHLFFSSRHRLELEELTPVLSPYASLSLSSSSQTANQATTAGATSAANAPVHTGVPTAPNAPAFGTGVAAGGAAVAGGVAAAAASGGESQWGTAALPFRRPVSNDEENQTLSPFLDVHEERDPFGRLVDN